MTTSAAVSPATVSPSVTATPPVASGSAASGLAAHEHDLHAVRRAASEHADARDAARVPRRASRPRAGCCLRRARRGGNAPSGSATAIPGGMPEAGRYVGTASFATRAPGTGSPLASTTTPSTIPSSASSTFASSVARRPPRSSMTTSRAIGARPFARMRRRAGPAGEIAERVLAVLVGARVTRARLALQRDLGALDRLATVRPHLAARALGDRQLDGERGRVGGRHDDLRGAPRSIGPRHGAATPSRSRARRCRARR